MKLPALFLSSLMMTGAASAATTGFSVDITGNNNTPYLTFTNTGDFGVIEDITVSIGDTAYNFDAARAAMVVNGSLGFTLGSNLDTNTSGGLRSDFVFFSFSSFDPTDAFRFRVDVDIDNANTVEDYRTRFLPGGSVLVNFSGGLTDSLSVDLTPTAGNDAEPYFYAASVTDMAAVPLPAGLPLLLAGLGALGIARRKRS